MLLVVCQLSRDVIGYMKSRNVIGGFRSVKQSSSIVSQIVSCPVLLSWLVLLVCSFVPCRWSSTITEFFLITTPKLASNVCLRLLGNFPVSQVAGCRCTILAENTSNSLARSEEQIIFSQHSPKMLKVAPESFIHALLLFLGLSKFIVGCPWVSADFKLRINTTTTIMAGNKRTWDCVKTPFQVIFA